MQQLWNVCVAVYKHTTFYIIAKLQGYFLSILSIKRDSPYFLNNFETCKMLIVNTFIFLNSIGMYFWCLKYTNTM